MSYASLGAIPSPPCPKGWTEEPFDHVCWNASNPPGATTLPAGVACPAGKVARADKDPFSGKSTVACYTFKSDAHGFSFEDNVYPVCTDPAKAWDDTAQTCVAVAAPTTPAASKNTSVYWIGGAAVLAVGLYLIMK